MSHRDSRASSGQIAMRRAPAPWSRRRVRFALVRASGPPLQSSTTSSGRRPPLLAAADAAVYQPAHSRIIRFVFPHPVAPMITMCRAHAANGTVNTGCQRCPMARMVPPTGIRLPAPRSGTAPGAAVRPLAARTCRFHCRASKVIGADAIRPPIPLLMA